MDFLRSQFDKLLLACFVAFLLGMLFHLLRERPDSSAIAWLEKSVDMVTGALLALVTGRIAMPIQARETAPAPRPAAPAGPE
jgi:hypothetical protein